MSFLLEEEVMQLDISEIVHTYQNYGARVAVKYGLCKAIKTAYNHFMVSFIDSYRGISLRTSIVDSSNYNNVIVDSNEFMETLEKYYYSIAPATNCEVGTALLDVINRLFVKCVGYVENQASYYYNF